MRRGRSSLRTGQSCRLDQARDEVARRDVSVLNLGGPGTTSPTLPHIGEFDGIRHERIRDNYRRRMRHGLESIPQVGCGGFRIDLALKHPSHPDLYCLGIECAGATYHSSKTARDRGAFDNPF